MVIFANEEDEIDEDIEDTYELGCYSCEGRVQVGPETLINDVNYASYDFGDERIFDGNFAKKKYSLDDFTMLKTLGKGGYGTVYLAKMNNSNMSERKTYFAIKELKKAVLLLNTKDIIHTRSERNILELIKHPFIVDFVGSFQTNNRLYLIMEYLPGGELFSQLEKNKRLPEFSVRFYLAEIGLALNHLHMNGIVYRDLKPENIMLTLDGHLKLTDFGLSKQGVNEIYRTHTFCGTIEYMAPEVITRTGHGPAADWWSFGILMYDMLSGRPPFTSHHKNDTMWAILNAPLPILKYFSLDSTELIKHLLKRNPENRLGFGPYGFIGIKNHPFFGPINWELVEKRLVRPPLIPRVSNMEDTNNFASCFTNVPIPETPDDLVISCSKNEYFAGFSYVNENYFDLSNDTPGNYSMSHDFENFKR